MLLLFLCINAGDGGEVVLHAAGAAICRAINLALQLHAEGLGLYEMAVHTDTLQLTDELEPLSRTSASASASSASRSSASQPERLEPEELQTARPVPLQTSAEADVEGATSGGEGDERLLLARNNSAVHIRIRARRPLQFASAGSASGSSEVVPSGSSAAVLSSTQRS